MIGSSGNVCMAIVYIVEEDLLWIDIDQNITGFVNCNVCCNSKDGDC